MNVTEFAEQIVFGTTLEDKLAIPDKLSFVPHPNVPKVDSLIVPGRPTGMQMRHDSGGNLQPPSDDKLENESARGQLLHFLANHELLATELMALVLLKFPDAPRAFRQGVLVTLREEQEHTRMYMRRMKECGVEFGRYPLSGQFWRIVEPMKSPMDFVSRLSLTFEQANLDYSLHFASVFRQIGDLDTASVLQQIYEDETGHVQHGLHWFRQWKDPEQSDWQAYQDSLEFPMSPQRARGPRAQFNRDGRIRAGFTEEFVDAIEVFRQSRGRAPTVRWFDPAAEAELADRRSEKQSRLLDQLGRDLELTMIPLSRQDDVLLVRKMPARETLKTLIELGFDLPEFIPFDEREQLSERKLNRFAPWAWTPQNIAVTTPISDAARHAPLTWSSEIEQLFRKSWSCQRLGEWLSEPDCPNWLAPESCTGFPVNHLDEVKSALKTINQRGYSFAIIKRDLDASGRGQRRLDCVNGLNAADEKWLQALFSGSQAANQTIAIIEPQLDRIVDLSFLWRVPIESTEPDFLGWTRPIMSEGRRYMGTQLGNPLSDCDVDVRRLLLADRSERLQRLIEWLQTRMEKELSGRRFVGDFGVDAFVYRTPDGNLKIKPLCELNPRTTMGHVALNLKKKIAPGVQAEFRILTRGEYDVVEERLHALPPIVQTKDGRWKSGVVWLSEPDSDTKLIPVVLVGNEAIDKCVPSVKSN